MRALGCIAACLVLAVVLFFPGCSRTEPISSPRSIILISLDTLRPDHLGVYGYSRDTSPNLDAFAAEATLYENAYSTSGKTAEAHMSMFTSLYPSVHGVRTAMGKRVNVVSKDAPLLAEVLRDAGYKTAGFHSGGNVEARYGFNRGFERYAFGRMNRAIEWLGKNAADGPFFLFFHTYHVHDPYLPEPPFDTMFTEPYAGRIVSDRKTMNDIAGADSWVGLARAYWKRVDKKKQADIDHLIGLYDGLIRQLDKQLANLFRAIDRHAPEAVVVIVSDHGEEFGEHGRFVHEQLYEEVQRVPLMIRVPGRAAGRVARPVSLIDLAPTMLALLGLDIPEQFQGSPLDTPESIEREFVLAQMPNYDITTLRIGDHKLMRTKRGVQLYDLAADPGETSDLSRKPAAQSRLRALTSKLEEIDRANAAMAQVLARAAGRAELSREELERLKELGYVD